MNKNELKTEDVCQKPAMRKVPGPVPYLTFPDWETYEELLCGFTTKEGGVSEGEFASLNLATDRGDDATAVTENLRRWYTLMEVPAESVLRPHQTHTAKVVSADADTLARYRENPEVLDAVDGIVTDLREVAVGLSFADCVPVYFYDPERHVIGIAHAGWRGTVGRIVQETVRKMEEDFGCRTENIRAAVGPCIGQAHYQVDETVIRAVEECLDGEVPEGVLLPDGPGHALVDLARVNRELLLRCGIREEQILMGQVCTWCHGDTLYSHRKTGGRRGVQCAFMKLRGRRD